jgi:hypothetical protein
MAARKTTPKGTRKVCAKGHVFYKSSDCPTCPQCETARAPKEGFLTKLGAPARRALEHHGITTPAKLARKSEQELLGLHGLGPASLPTLRAVLAAEGLAFRKQNSRR